MSDVRIDTLERRVNSLDSTLEKVDGKLDSIGMALTSLARIEERQISNKEKLDAYSESIDMLRHDIDQKAHHRDGRIRDLELAVPENLSKRLNTIESHIPGLLESKRWVSMGLLALVGVVGAAIIHLVVK